MKFVCLCCLPAVLFISMIGTTASSVTADDKKATVTIPAKTFDHLMERIKRLEKKVEQLEKRALPVIQPVTVPQIVPQTKVVPRNWSRDEINGQEFFIVPLNQTAKPTIVK